MKTSFCGPVCRENFADAWAFTDRCRCAAKKRQKIAVVAALLSHLTFCAALLFTAMGLLCLYSPGDFADFLKGIPSFCPIWDSSRTFLGISGKNLLTDACLALLGVYIASFAMCCTTALLVWVGCHVPTRKCPQGPEKQNADRLLTAARQAQRHAAGTHVGNSVLSAIVFFLGLLLLLAFYWISTEQDTEGIILFFASPLQAVLQPYIADADMLMRILGTAWLICVMLEWAVLFLAYMLLDQLLAVCMRPLLRYRLPEGLVEQAEGYSAVCMKNTTAPVTDTDFAPAT